ncbi:uncharacterized protein LOC134196983 [Corticium candelabrum]|uniref:uncharacterized protein LOC134196983 n=1 Tax=Corticium candelabrum TaxID=121492 RepID=UPI002E2674AA|nr:uncharacterized protein LOC134196983 [Corticium candelabrum]
MASLIKHKQECDEQKNDNTSQFVCPVCLRRQEFSVSNLASVKSHVDVCLSGKSAAEQEVKKQTKRKSTKLLESSKKESNTLFILEVIAQFLLEVKADAHLLFQHGTCTED